MRKLDIKGVANDLVNTSWITTVPGFIKAADFNNKELCFDVYCADDNVVHIPLLDIPAYIYRRNIVSA